MHVADRIIKFLFPGPTDHAQYCPECGGTGFNKYWQVCTRCNGIGYIEEDE